MPNRSSLPLAMLLLSCFLLVLAVQTSASKNNTFWDSFWPALWSGALYSLVIGYVVLVIFEIQRCRRELHTARSQLRSRLMHAGRLDRDTALYCAPQGATAVCDALDSYPIDLWQERLQERTGFIRLLQAIQSSYGEFVGVTSQFDRLLHDLVHVAQQRDQDNPEQEAYIRRTYYTSLFDWVRRKDDDRPPLPTIAFQHVDLGPVQRNEELNDAARQIKRYYYELEKLLEDLRQDLQAG